MSAPRNASGVRQSRRTRQRQEHAPASESPSPGAPLVSNRLDSEGVSSRLSRRVGTATAIVAALSPFVIYLLQECLPSPPPEETVVRVLSGADVATVTTQLQQELRDAGYVVQLGPAITAGTTTVSYERGDRSAAILLRDAFLPTATLEEMKEGEIPGAATIEVRLGRQDAACHPSYPSVCVPGPPPDLDCSDVIEKAFRVLEPDPHGFDTDGDGTGCET